MDRQFECSESTASRHCDQRRRPGRRFLGAAVAVALGLGMALTWVPGRSSAGPPDTSAFGQAIANLASAPGVSYSDNLGFATLEMRFSAAGEAIGSMRLGGANADQTALNVDMMEIDGRLFLKCRPGCFHRSRGFRTWRAVGSR